MKILNIGILMIVATVCGWAQNPSSAANGGKNAEESGNNCGLIYGKDHSLTICAPDGWTLDNSVLNDLGVYAVFYPNGSNWQDAKDSGTVMYVNVLGKAPGSTAAKMMADDAAQTKQHAQGALLKQGEPIKIGDISVPVQCYAPGAYHRYEAIAYVDEEKVLIMIAITSKNEKTYNRDYPKFVQLVRSYKFLSADVTVQNK